jgi:F0F1-type ATP synthase assembly protein I
MSATPRPTTRANDALVVRRSAWNGIDQSGIIGAELVSAVLIWAFAGYWVDRWLGTAPWFLVIGALVGNAAGIYLIWLRAKRMDVAEAALTGGPPRG